MTTNKKPANAAGSLTGWATRLSEEVSSLGDRPRIVPSLDVLVRHPVRRVERVAAEGFSESLVHHHVGVAVVVAVANALVRLGLVAVDHLAKVGNRKRLHPSTKGASKADFLLDRSHQFNSPVDFNTNTMNPINNIVNTINASSHANP